MLPFEFTRPTLMILILPIAIVLGIWFVRSLTDFPRPQRIASLIARSILGLLLVLSLAGTDLVASHARKIRAVPGGSKSQRR